MQRVAENMKLFDFVQVTANEAYNANHEFFNDESYRDTAPVNRFWMNVRGSPRNRRGKMHAKRWAAWSILIWVRAEKVGQAPYWKGEAVVLEAGEFLLHKTTLGNSEKQTTEEIQWIAWLALLEHLKYITNALDFQLS